MVSSWIEVVAGWVRAVWPFHVVHTYERGVRFRWGKVCRRPAGPGMYFLWWWAESMVTVPVAERSVDLVTQSFTLKDRTALTLSGKVTFRITDAVANYCDVFCFDTSLANEAMGAYATVVAPLTLGEFLGTQPQVIAAIQAELQRYAQPWGATITRIRLTDFVVAVPLRVYGDPPAA